MEKSLTQTRNLGDRELMDEQTVYRAQENPRQQQKKKDNYQGNLVDFNNIR